MSHSFLQASSVPHHHLHGDEMELQLLPRRELLRGNPRLQLPAWIHRAVVGRTEGYLILFATYVETPGLSGVSSRWPSRGHKHKHNLEIIPLTSTAQKQIYVSATVFGKHIQIQNRCRLPELISSKPSGSSVGFPQLQSLLFLMPLCG